MKKLLFFLCAGMVAFWFSISPSLADSGDKEGLSLRDELLMEHIILMLWDMDYTSPRQMSPADLCRRTMTFMMHGQSDLGEYRDEDNSDNSCFINIPDRYSLFFPKKAVEDVALNIFGGWLDGHTLPDRYFRGSNGYYIDMQATIDDRARDFADEVWLPSYAEISSAHMEADGTRIINGKLRRFKMLDDSVDQEEILWIAATFMARFSPVKNGWKLETFVITGEPMG